MKKLGSLLVGILLSVCVISSVSFAYNPAKQHARQIYRRTATVLVEAQDAARIGHKYQGLNRAFAHQRLARDYYYTRNFQRSIDHSLWSRQIAFNVIERNIKGPRNHREPDYDTVEMRYYKNINQNDLDTKVSDNDDDEVSLKVKINLDL